MQLLNGSTRLQYEAHPASGACWCSDSKLLMRNFWHTSYTPVIKL